DQRIATGFNRNHRGNGEGGIIPEEYAVEYVADRVDTTATVWLGMTLACARCHSHKFDPIGHDDFYRFFALFNNVPEQGRAVKYGNSPPLLSAPTRDQANVLARLEVRYTGALHQRRCIRHEIDNAQAAWESKAKAEHVPDWTLERDRVVRFVGNQASAS